jgi:DNA-directed RNA polymerase specialized sigma24 family protein
MQFLGAAGVEGIMDKADSFDAKDLERYWKVVRAEAGRQLWDPKLAEEVAEEAYFHLMVRLTVYQPPETPGAWLIGVVRNLKNKLLSKPRAKDVNLGDLDPDQVSLAPASCEHENETFPADRWVEWRELLKVLEPRILCALTKYQCRIYYHLRRERSINQVARKCGIAPKDVREAIRKIASKARRILVDQHPFPPLEDSE